VASHLQKLIFTGRDVFNTIHALSPTKEIVICKFIHGNFVEFLHAALERECGEEPLPITTLDMSVPLSKAKPYA
jgi:hypothetical protein